MFKEKEKKKKELFGFEQKRKKERKEREKGWFQKKNKVDDTKSRIEQLQWRWAHQLMSVNTVTALWKVFNTSLTLEMITLKSVCHQMHRCVASSDRRFVFSKNLEQSK